MQHVLSGEIIEQSDSLQNVFKNCTRFILKGGGKKAISWLNLSLKKEGQKKNLQLQSDNKIFLFFEIFSLFSFSEFGICRDIRVKEATRKGKVAQ